MRVPDVRLRGLRTWLSLVLFAALAAACGDDAPPRPDAPGPMVAGPFSGQFALTEQTRLRLPVAEDALAPSDLGRFYWYAPQAEGASLRFEVRAETTALAAETVVHREEQAVAAGQRQGFFTVDPRALSEGGGRRVGAHFEWLPGLYSVHGSLGDAEIGMALFEVR